MQIGDKRTIVGEERTLIGFLHHGPAVWTTTTVCSMCKADGFIFVQRFDEGSTYCTYHVYKIFGRPVLGTVKLVN